MTKRRRRGLSSEDQALWQKVADQTVPMHPKKQVSLPAALDPGPPAKPAESPIRKPFEIGSLARRAETAVKPEVKNPAGDEIRVGRKTHAHMKRGKLQPEARLDLHGLTLNPAQPALTRFLFDQYDKHRRLVLVITGKGKDRDQGGPVPERRGALKQYAPLWMSQAPLNGIVLQVSEAHIKHGGEGAYYVYLRRRR